MRKPRPSSKAIPRSADIWLRELHGAFAFLMNCPVAREDFGEKWTRAMLAHHKARFILLPENPPRDLPEGFIMPRLPDEFK